MAGNGAKRRAAVIGGGVSGLATAYYLGQAGVKVDVFEAEAQTGGLAAGFDLDGLNVEKYYHFITLIICLL